MFAESSYDAAKVVEWGASDVGIIALTLASSAEMKTRGRYWVIPEAAYPLQEICSVLLKDAENSDNAKAFLLFIHSKRGRETMLRYGLRTPK